MANSTLTIVKKNMNKENGIKKNASFCKGNKEALIPLP